MPNTEIKIQPSRQFISLILVIVIGSISIICALGVGLLIKSFLLSMTIYYWHTIFYRYGILQHPQAWIKLNLNADGSCLVHQQRQQYEAQLSGNSIITNFVCILRFTLSEQQKKHSCLIFRDAIQPDLYRRLLIQLRCMK